MNPNSFPYLTLSFYPENKILLAGGHHSIKKTGFIFFNNMFKYYKLKYKDKLFDYLKYMGTVTWKGTTCYKFVLNYPEYKISKYSIKKGDNLTRLASKQFLNIAKLRELNPNVKEKKELIPGHVISITNVYGKKAVFYLDSKSYLPVYQEIYDEKGLYEKYAFINVKYGKVIPDDEFSLDFKDYNF